MFLLKTRCDYDELLLKVAGTLYNHTILILLAIFVLILPEIFAAFFGPTFRLLIHVKKWMS